MIGAGVQSLLHILCPLIEGRKKIAFYNPGFRQGRAVFEDHGFELCDRKQEQPDVCYVSPSQATAWGDVCLLYTSTCAKKSNFTNWDLC